MVLLITAFRTAWPAFAYSIEDDAGGEADVRVRAHVPRRARVLARARARAALAVARAAARDARVLRGRARRRAARVRRRRLRRVHRDGDRRRPREADAVQLGDRRARAALVSVALNLAARSRPRDDGLGGRRRRRVLDDVPRDDLVRAARLPDAVPVAARRHRRRRGGRADASPASCSTCRSRSRSCSSPPTRSRCSSSASSCRRSGARSAPAHGPPGVPRDLQDHERDREADQRVGDRAPSDGERAQTTPSETKPSTRAWLPSARAPGSRAAGRRAGAPAPRPRCRRTQRSASRPPRGRDLLGLISRRSTRNRQRRPRRRSRG